MNKIQLTTLADLAQDLQINKSKLLYYLDMGLIEPIDVMGVTGIYDKKKTIAIVKKIKVLQNKGYSLKQIGLEIK